MRYLILFFYLLSTLPASATLNEVDKTQIFNKNLLPNGGFENGKGSGSGKWTASAGTFAVTGTSPMVGLYHATWDAAASGNTLTSTAIAIPAGWYGRNGAVSCLITTASGTATHEIQAYDGSNILSESTVTSSTTPARSSANFIFPSSGSISLRIYANADEPSIAIDDCYLGPAEGYNLGSVSQAQFIGSAYFATPTNCTFTVTSTTLAALSDSDCPGPTVEYNPGPGTIQTTDANAPSVTVNNLPPGLYEVIFTGGVANGSSNQTQAMAISDGTTQSGQQTVNGGNASYSAFTLVGYFSYTTSGNRTFQIFASASANAVIIGNNASNARTTFSIKKFPLSNEQVFTTDQSDFGWTAYTPTLGAAFGTPTLVSFFYKRIGDTLYVRGTATNGTVANSLATISLPGSLTIDTTKLSISNNTSNNGMQVGEYNGLITQTYTPIVTAPATSTTLVYLGNQVNQSARLTPGTTSAGISLQTGGHGAFTFAVPVTGWQNTNRAPQLVNSVVNPSSGVTHIASAFISNSGTPTVTRQDGTWISSLTDNGTGDTTINFSANTFSATPNCVCTDSNGASAGFGCLQDASTAMSSSQVRIQTFNTTVPTDRDFMIICMGPK